MPKTKEYKLKIQRQIKIKKEYNYIISMVTSVNTKSPIKKKKLHYSM